MDAREKIDAEVVNVGERLTFTDWDAREPDEMETFIHLHLNLTVSQVPFYDVYEYIFFVFKINLKGPVG